MDQASPMQWSNHGVLLLEMGRIDDAKVLFKQALNTLGVLNGRRGIRRYTPADNRKHLPVPARVIAGWSHNLTHNNIDGIFVFARALNLHPVYNDDLFNVYAGSILFNLGLAHHLLSIKNAAFALNSEQARTLYNSAMNFLHQDDDDQEEAETSLETELLMAILFNNTGQVFYDAFMETESAYQCFRAVSSIMVNLELNGRNTSTAIQEGDVTGLLSNLVFRQTTSAPAA
jgi:tetratricopeptide (TPR) repeat protein